MLQITIPEAIFGFLTLAILIVSLLFLLEGHFYKKLSEISLKNKHVVVRYIYKFRKKFLIVFDHFEL